MELSDIHTLRARFQEVTNNKRKPDAEDRLVWDLVTSLLPRRLEPLSPLREDLRLISNGLVIITLAVLFDLLGHLPLNRILWPLSMRTFNRSTATRLEDADLATLLILTEEIPILLTEA